MAGDTALPARAAAIEALKAAVEVARQKSLRPPPRLHVDEWADRFRILSPEASSSPGRYRTSKVEVARGPMRAVTEPGVREISTMVCTQLFKTENLNNILAYRMHLNPGPMLVIQPTEGMAESWSKDRLSTMIRDTPELREIVSVKARDSQNTILHKLFPGGHVTMVGSNSPAELASRPVRDIFEDEGDKWPLSAGAEGDPGSLAEERAGTFPSSRLFYRSCSPTLKGKSWIGSHYENSDQRKPFVPCPHCGIRQVLKFGSPEAPGGVKWSKNADGKALTEEAAYHCPHCGCAWSEAQRLAALQLVDWRQTKKFKCCGVDQDPVARHEIDPESVFGWDLSADENGKVFCWRALCSECGKRAVSNKHAGFWASKLYSPWEPMSALADKFLKARPKPETFQVFVNTSLAELWEEQGEQVESESLIARREAFPCGAYVPDEVVCLFSAVDVQRDRLEVQTIGLGRDEQIWIVDYRIVMGDAADPKILVELEKEIWRPRTRADGRVMFPEVTTIDVGDGAGAAAAMYRFCEEHKGSRCLPIRGAKDLNALVWARKPNYSKKHRAVVYFVGTQRTKSLLFRRLAIPRGPASDPFPPGYIHLSRDVCDQNYLDQLTSEKLTFHELGGRTWYEWKPKAGARNEALDTLVYAWAAYNAWLATGGNLAMAVRDRSFQGSRHKEIISVPAQPDAPVSNDLTPPTADAGDAASPIVTVPVSVPAPPPARKAPRRQDAWMSQRKGWIR